MGNSNASTLPDGQGPVNADEIRWTLGPAPDPIEVDLLAFDSLGEAFDYMRSVQEEAAWLRSLLHEALSQLHDERVQHERGRIRIQQLTDENRRLRAGRGAR